MDFSYAISNGCGNSIPNDEMPLSNNSTSHSVIVLFFRFRKRDCTLLPGFGTKKTSRGSRVSAAKSESNRHPFHFFASRRSSGQPLFSVLLPGRRRKFEKALSNLHRH